MKKTSLSGIIILFFLSTWSLIPVASNGQEAVRIKASPNETAERMINNPILKKLDGENFCWNAANGIQVFVDNYELLLMR